MEAEEAMSKVFWSDPHPREPVIPIVVVLSTLSFAAFLGYEATKGAIGIYEWLTGHRIGGKP